MKLHLSDLKKFTSLAKIQTLAKDRRVNVYLVGGALRDCLLGYTNSQIDFDFALESGSVDFARILSKKLKAPFVLLDEPHGCARVIFKDRGRLIDLDFSDFRAKTITADLEKRDFTINALAIKLEDVFSFKGKRLRGRIIDPFGGGKDILAKTIRLIAPDNFKDDPLRILRAFSLCARLGFKIDKLTMARMRKDSPRIKDSASERVREELFKIFSAGNSKLYLRQIEDIGLLEIIIPEIKSMYKLRQGAYHHLDVWRHSRETFEKLEDIVNNPPFPYAKEIKEYLCAPISGAHRRCELLKFAALLHDIGKPPTFSVTAGKVHFYGHERIGARIAERVFTRLKLSSKEIKVLKLLIYCHLRPGYMSDIRDLSRRAIFRFFRDCQEEAVSVILLSLADQRATRGKLKKAPERLRHEKLVKVLIREFFSKANEVNPVRLLTGYDILNSLKIDPGPVVGRILNEISEAQAEGLLSTKLQALEWAKKFYKQEKRNAKV